MVCWHVLRRLQLSVAVQVRVICCPQGRAGLLLVMATELSQLSTAVARGDVGRAAPQLIEDEGGQVIVGATLSSTVIDCVHACPQGEEYLRENVKQSPEFWPGVSTLETPLF